MEPLIIYVVDNDTEEIKNDMQELQYELRMREFRDILAFPGREEKARMGIPTQEIGKKHPKTYPIPRRGKR